MPTEHWQVPLCPPRASRHDLGMSDDEPLSQQPDSASGDQPDKNWQAEASKWKALARKYEKAAKESTDAARPPGGGRGIGKDRAGAVGRGPSWTWG